jgi:hypothetical protein
VDEGEKLQQGSCQKNSGFLMDFSRTYSMFLKNKAGNIDALGYLKNEQGFF